MDRTFRVPKETRMFAVAAERRSFMVPRETRQFRAGVTQMPKILAVCEKTAAEILDYSIDFSDALLEGEESTNLVWAVSEGLAVQSHTEDNFPVCTATISGGQVGRTYLATCTLSTTEGLNTRVIERSLSLRVV